MTNNIDRQRLAAAIIAGLDRGDAKDSSWPDAKGEYWALCPYHADTHTGSFSFNAKKGAYKCHACSAKGGLLSLAKQLNIDIAGYYLQTPPDQEVTLANYAQRKQLDIDELRSYGLRDAQRAFPKGAPQKPAVYIPYYDQDGTAVLTCRHRIGWSGAKKIIAKAQTKLQPYGLWRLKDAQQAGYIYLVEGESDCHTLWHYGIPALGMPGAVTFQPEWAKFLDGIPVIYAWQETDHAGEQFIERIGGYIPTIRVIEPPAGRKDVSDMHLLGDDVPAVLESLQQKARPWSEILANKLNIQAQNALDKSIGLLSRADILADFEQLVGDMGMVGESRLAKLLYLALTSRLLSDPVSMILKGPSSSGKSFSIATVLKAFPDESHLDYTSMSDRALIYDERPIAHKVIVLYEAAGMGRDTQSEPSALAYFVRSLLSEGCINYDTVEHTPDGLQPRHIHRAGPTSLITSTTWGSLHSENETRALSVTLRDDPAQTRAVLSALGDRCNGKNGHEPDLSPWIALQEWLELAGRRNVIIPYARELASLCNAKAVRLRRDFGKVLTLIQTHAILHQMNRQIDDRGRLIATLDDYTAIYPLVIDILNEAVQASVSPIIRETVIAVKNLYQKSASASVSMVELAAEMKVDKATVSRRARAALDLGYLVNNEDKRGRPAKLIPGDPMPQEQPVLPTPQALAAELNKTAPMDIPADIPVFETATDPGYTVDLDEDESGYQPF